MKPRLNRTLLAASTVLSPLILWLLYVLLYRLGIGVPDGVIALKVCLVLVGVFYNIVTWLYLMVSGVNSGRL